MPHVSKRKLDEEQVDDLFLQIVYVLERASNRGKLKWVLKQLLTPTEKVMFAKRLAVISMLSQNVPIFDIAENLSMSPSTIDIMSLKFESGRYSDVVKNGLRNRDITDIIRMIETIGGMMPPRGKGRWKYLGDGFKKSLVEHRLRKLSERKKKIKK